MTRFQSTLSLRRATNSSIIFYIFKLFQSTLSLRRATLTGSLPMTIPTISIHALLAESDPPLPPAGGGRQISIHALLAESDLRSCFPLCRSGHFNPRSPCGERHCLLCFCASTAWNFNPRSPCGERPWQAPSCSPQLRISIHALLTESDLKCISLRNSIGEFQSTLSSRRATCGYDSTLCHRRFQSTLSSRRATIAWASSASLVAFQSTLSSRRATGIPHFSKTFLRYFNPRSPHGERLDLNNQRGLPLNFNPRSPHGERLRCRLGLSGSISISIHALLTESDFATFRFVIFHIDFNPRSPHGERRVFRPKGIHLLGISIHALLTESDRRTPPAELYSP